MKRMHYFVRSTLGLILLSAGFVVGADCKAATFVVTSNGDSGAGTLVELGTNRLYRLAGY